MNLQTILIFIGMGLVFVFVKIILPSLKSNKPKTSTLIYKSKPTILTPTEQKFFQVLEELKSPETAISVQVRISDIITPANKETRRTALNKIQSKHIDFVLFNRETFKIIAAIELNDSSHQRKDRQTRDKFLTEAFSTTETPLIWIQAKQSYNPEEIRKAISKKIKPA